MTFNSVGYTPVSEKEALTRCAVAIAIPLVAGSIGFCWIEPNWSLWDSLYFTLVTITTVGYGDRGLSLYGERFAAILLVCGIAIYTYALGTLVQLATHSELRWKRKMQKIISKLSGHAIVCGYGRIGRAVCNNLRKNEKDFVVVECDEGNYREAVEDGHLVVLGSASEDGTLHESSVQTADVVICAVDSDADNSFIAMCVKELNPNATIATRCESESSTSKLRRAGATVIVSPHEMAGDYLSNAILRPHLTELLDNHHETAALSLAEIEIHPDSEIIGQTIRTLGHEEPSIVFVAAARFGEKPKLRPGADRTFEANDVVIVAANEQCVQRLRELAATERQTVVC